jgi:hypothetical protein
LKYSSVPAENSPPASANRKITIRRVRMRNARNTNRVSVARHVSTTILPLALFASMSLDDFVEITLFPRAAVT